MAKFNHPNSVKVAEFAGGFTEYDSRGNVTFSYKYRNNKSATVVFSDSGFVSEYDQYGRNTFWKMP